MIKHLKILFLKWQIKIMLHKYHLARNPIGSGRRKKEKPIEADYKLSDQISNEYRTSHLQGKFPGKNMGD